LSFLIIGAMVSYSHPFIAMLLMGIGTQQAGWIAHDYIHGRDAGNKFLGYIFASWTGLSRDWWSHKHNTHHVFPNRKEYDVDIQNEPILHLWFPPKDKDVWYRKYQHRYYLVAFTFLLFSWRLQSLQFVMGSRNWLERVLLLINYAMLACLPISVAIGHILIGGFLVAIVVTANHQTEPVIEANDKYNFVRDQFFTTRGIHCPDWITEYLCGGMQYQLEHHLFPIMPKAYYPQVRPIIQQFAIQNKMKYHISGIVEILKLNYEVMKQFSQ